MVLKICSQSRAFMVVWEQTHMWHREVSRTMEGRCGAGGGVPFNIDGVLDCQGQAAQGCDGLTTGVLVVNCLGIGNHLPQRSLSRASSRSATPSGTLCCCSEARVKVWSCGARQGSEVRLQVLSGQGSLPQLVHYDKYQQRGHDA